MTAYGFREIITLNYDLLIERALNRTTKAGVSEPLFQYGGFPSPQFVRKMKNISQKGSEIPVQLGTDYTIYKLHGSLNWAFEHHNSNMKIHNDARAAFRINEKVGGPAIIPPIAEKELPIDFQRIWRQARNALVDARNWVVCGYSLPPYDIALSNWLSETIKESNVRKIFILDPQSEALAPRWVEMGRPNVDVVPLAGIPDSLADNLGFFDQLA